MVHEAEKEVIKVKGLILTALAMTVTVAAFTVQPKEPVATGIKEITVSTAKEVDVPYLDFDLEQLAIMQEYREAHEETTEPAEVEEPELVNLGAWTITAYCSCPECCGECATGYTASGTVATAGRTIACNSLPFGTQVMIDGTVYTVEDTGWSPFGENWIDIYFDTHDEALSFGVQEKEIYLLKGE